MKNLRYLILIVILVAACSDKDKESPEAENRAPGTPVLTVPSDLKLCLDNGVVFKWDAAVDPDKDVVVYQIQVALDNAFSNIVQTKEAGLTDQMLVLEKNAHYYWRVKATDSKGLSGGYSAIRSFYTAGDPKINHLPFAPELLQPMAELVQNTAAVTLEWSATDPDPGDTLVYDVYFGTTNPPTEKIATDNTMPRIPDVSVKPNTAYFWQVVVKDNHESQTKGQIWSFKTN